MIGSLEFARRSGITDIVTVIDPVMDRVLKRSDCAPYDYVGSTVQMGKAKALAALLDCTPERIARLRAYSEISGDVFLTDDEALALTARREDELLQGNCSYEDLISYCEDQVARAVTAHDCLSADRLCRMLLDEADAARITATGRASLVVH
jgi:acyl homoserine lactone synthase